MISKEQLLNAILHEIKIIRHLGTKLPLNALDYRPTEAQRSTLELMQYLTVCGVIGCKWVVNDNWEHVEGYHEAAGKVCLDSFDDAMERQANELKELFEGITSEDFAQKDSAMPWGSPGKMGEILMQTVLSCFTAYRMQFFLYLKSAGASELNSAQCWMGIDPPPAPAE